MEKIPTTRDILKTPEIPKMSTVRDSMRELHEYMETLGDLNPKEKQLLVANHLQMNFLDVLGKDMDAFVEEKEEDGVMTSLASKYRALLEAHPEYIERYLTEPEAVLREMLPAFAQPADMH